MGGESRTPTCHALPQVSEADAALQPGSNAGLRDWEIGRLFHAPPGNRLEALKGNRAGQYSIRINEQFRICFRWGPEGPEDVEIVDYH